MARGGDAVRLVPAGPAILSIDEILFLVRGTKDKTTLNTRIGAVVRRGPRRRRRRARLHVVTCSHYPDRKVYIEYYFTYLQRGI